MLPEQRVKLKNLMESAKACFIQAFGIFIIILTAFIFYGGDAFRSVTILFASFIFFETLLEGLIKLCDAVALVKIYRATGGGAG
jgi:hypothetical protein